MISKMTEPYIICGDTQIPTEKDTSALTWFQRSQSFTSFAGRFRSQLRKTVQYWNDLKDYRTLHPLKGDSDPNWERQFSIEMITKMTEPYILWGDIQIPIDRTSHLLLEHSNSTEKDSSVLKWFQRWRTRTSFVVTFKSNWKTQFSVNRFERSQNFKSFVGTFKSQLKKPDHYRNDYKDDITLHSLWGHLNINWKR